MRVRLSGRSGRVSVTLSDGYLVDKRERIEQVSKRALDLFEGLLDDIAQEDFPETRSDFASLGTRLQVVSEALLGVAEEMK
jgi:hypothetical protein